MSKIRRIDDIGHAWWYAGSNESGKCSAMFFEGPSIYSWGKHYEIARKVNSTLVLINVDHYGTSSTSRHVNIVKDAIPHHVKKLEVKRFFDNSFSKKELKKSHLENLQAYEEQVKHIVGTGINSRATRKLANVKEIIDQMSLYIETFKISPVPSAIKYRIKNGITEKEIAQVEQQKIKKQQEAKNRAEQLILENKERIKKWRTGKKDDISHLPGVFLRLIKKKQFVESSKGTSIPIFQASLLQKVLAKEVKIGGDNKLQTITIDQYKVTGWDHEILTIGCHKINVEELNYICKRMKWKTPWTLPQKSSENSKKTTKKQ